MASLINTSMKHLQKHKVIISFSCLFLKTWVDFCTDNYTIFIILNIAKYRQDTILRGNEDTKSLENIVIEYFDYYIIIILYNVQNISGIIDKFADAEWMRIWL